MKKLFVSLIISALMICLLLPFASYAKNTEVVYISSAEEFSAISKDRSGYYVLNADIDLGKIAYSQISTFNGTLDGRGHTIKGLNSALFKTISGGYVKNLNFSECSVEASVKSGSLGLIANTLKNGIIENITIDPSCIVNMFSDDGSAVGGAVGIASENYLVKQVRVFGKVFAVTENEEGFYTLGGVVGKTEGSGCVSACEFSGKIVGSGIEENGIRVGGIVGSQLSGEVRCCVNKGYVSADAYNACVGGIVGRCEEDGIINYCVNKGEVKASVTLGGIVGFFSGSGECAVGVIAVMPYPNYRRTADYSPISGSSTGSFKSSYALKTDAALTTYEEFENVSALSAAICEKYPGIFMGDTVEFTAESLGYSIEVEGAGSDILPPATEAPVTEATPVTEDAQVTTEVTPATDDKEGENNGCSCKSSLITLSLIPIILIALVFSFRNGRKKTYGIISVILLVSLMIPILSLIPGSISYTSYAARTNLPDYEDGYEAKVFYDCGTGIAADSKTSTVNNSLLKLYSSTSEEYFREYISILEKTGYSASVNDEDGIVSAQIKGYDMNLYLYYTKSLRETRIIYDIGSNSIPETLSENHTKKGNAIVYQYNLDYNLEHCGMSYVIRLEDGSLVILDGGHNNQSTDAELERFYNFIKKVSGTGDGKIKIASWFISHAHGDHAGLPGMFIKKYHDSLDIESVMFNFPSISNFNHDSSASTFKTQIRTYYPDCLVYKLHTGQKFDFGSMNLKVMYTHEDALTPGGTNVIVNDLNSTSTVLKVEIGDSDILFLGDVCSIAENRMLLMYDDCVFESDIVQASHHGYNSMQEFYRLACAKHVFIPQARAFVVGDKRRLRVMKEISSFGDPKIYYGDGDTEKIEITNGSTITITSED